MKIRWVCKIEILHHILRERDHTNMIRMILIRDRRRKAIIILSRIYYTVNYLLSAWKFDIASCTKYKVFGKCV
jgi:hypothetical protein